MAYNFYNLAFAGLLFIFIVNRIRSNISVARFKKAHGCQPEKRLMQRERIVGWDLYSSQVQASKNKNILEVGLKRFNDTGPTYSAGKRNHVVTLTGSILTTSFQACWVEHSSTLSIPRS